MAKPVGQLPWAHITVLLDLVGPQRGTRHRAGRERDADRRDWRTPGTAGAGRLDRPRHGVPGEQDRQPASGDRDSIGLVQQRPSQGWGTPQQVSDPYCSLNAFFDGLAKIPNVPRAPPRSSPSESSSTRSLRRPGHRAPPTWRPPATRRRSKSVTAAQAAPKAALASAARAATRKAPRAGRRR